MTFAAGGGALLLSLTLISWDFLATTATFFLVDAFLVAAMTQFSLDMRLDGWIRISGELQRGPGDVLQHNNNCCHHPTILGRSWKCTLGFFVRLSVALFCAGPDRDR
jgi:hypothetical protein